MKLKKLIISLAVIIAGFTGAMAQEKITVSGTVSDNMGPVAGVGVMQKGTANGVATDMDGRYSITVPSGSILVFESIGYTTQEITATRPQIDVVLTEDLLMLEETVVVGYGVQKKSDITGAISSVKSEDLQNRAISSVEGGLQGKTSGVQLVTTSAKPGSTPVIRVRGFSSNGTSDPLFVVDGLRLSSLESVDPSTIESIEILKDAASAAIYGAQAGNGVVLVTTKSGKKGEGTISYDMQYSIMALGRTPKLINSQEEIMVMKERNPIYDDTYIRTNFIDNGIWDGQRNTDWMKGTFGTGHLQKHTISFQGGNDRGSIFASLNYYDENGIIIGDRDTYKRLSGTVNATYRIKDWLRIGTNNTIEKYDVSSFVDGGGQSNIYSSALNGALMGSPMIPVTYSPDNLPDAMKNYLAAGYPMFRDANGDYFSVVGGYPQPQVSIRMNNISSYGFNLIGTSFVELTPLEGLTLTSKVGYRFSNAHTYYYQNRYVASNMSMNLENNPVSRTNSTTMYYQWENYASYHRTFADAHTVDALAGMSFSQNDLTYLLSGASNVMKDDPLFADVSFAAGDAAKNAQGKRTFNRNLSYYARLGYNYNGRYYIQGIFRADAADTSILPAANRWGYFPGVSAGWNFTNEEFFPKLGWLQSGKLRASWGQNGSISNLGNYIYSNAIIQTAQGYPYGATPTYVIAGAPGQVENPKLTWETSEQLDLGLDLVLLDGRLTFSTDWYRKETKDLIVTGSQLPLEVGNNAAPINAGNVLNTGFEFDLGWKDTIGDFSYGINANLATLNNRVTYLDPNIADNRIYSDIGILTMEHITAFEVGYPVWYFYGYKVKDIFFLNGNPEFEDINGDGAITAADRTYLGSAIPSMTFGITLSAAWKGLDFMVFGAGSVGNKVFNGLNPGTFNYNFKEIFDNRWTPDNREAKYASPAINSSIMNNYIISDANVFDASFFKIKQIQLGYTLPGDFTGKFKVQRIRVFASLDDFFVFTKYIGLDPEVSASATSGMGVDFGTYPNTRKFMFGLNITF